MEEMFVLKLTERKPLPSLGEVFSFTLEESHGVMYHYADETGIMPGEANPENTIRFVFLLNAPEIASARLTHEWADHAFYLDENKIDRAPKSRHFQLLYDPGPDNISFRAWAASVMKYLGACYHSPSGCPLDVHDISGVLQSMKQRRLHFKLISGIKQEGIGAAFSALPKTKNTLSILFFSPPSPFPAEIHWDVDEVEPGSMAEFRVGGALHPYEELILMVLTE